MRKPPSDYYEMYKNLVELQSPRWSRRHLLTDAWIIWATKDWYATDEGKIDRAREQIVDELFKAGEPIAVWNAVTDPGDYGDGPATNRLLGLRR